MFALTTLNSKYTNANIKLGANGITKPVLLLSVYHDFISAYEEMVNKKATEPNFNYLVEEVVEITILEAPTLITT